MNELKSDSPSRLIRLLHVNEGILEKITNDDSFEDWLIAAKVFAKSFFDFTKGRGDVTTEIAYVKYLKQIDIYFRDTEAKTKCIPYLRTLFSEVTSTPEARLIPLEAIYKKAIFVTIF